MNWSSRTLMVWLVFLALEQANGYAQSIAFQEFAYRRISTSEGLPTSTIYNLHQDEEGWIWLGTAAGLFRYDGVSFIPYQSSEARQRAIHDLKRGPDGQLYAQNFRGQLFRVAADSLELVGDFKELCSTFISYAFRQDSLLVAVDSGILSCPLDTIGRHPSKNSGFPISKTRFPPIIHALQSGGGLLDAAPDQPRFTTVVDQYPDLFTQDYYVFSTRDQGDSTWVVSRISGKRVEQHAIVIFSVDAEQSISTQRTVRLPTDFIGTGKVLVQAAPDGSLLISGSKGLLLVEPTYKTGDPLPNLLPGTTVRDILVDKVGTVWVATANQGLFLIPELQSRRSNFPMLHAPLVDLAAGAGDSILFGITRDGSIYQLLPTLIRLSQSGMSDKFWTDDLGTIYCGPVVVYPDRSPEFEHVLQCRYGSIKDGVKLPDGTIALATSARTAILDPYRATPIDTHNSWLAAKPVDTVYALSATPSNPVSPPKLVSLRNRRSTSLTYDPKRDELIVAYVDSLLAYGTTSSKPRALTILPDQKAARIVQLVGDSLYVATIEQDLYALNLASGAVSEVLHNMSIQQLCWTGSHLWIRTDTGLYRSTLKRGDMGFERMDTRMGHPAEQVTAFYTNKNHAYIAYGKQVVRIRTEQPARKSSKSRILIAKAALAGKILKNPVAQPLRMNADNQTLRLTPRLASYLQAPTTTFEYRLPARDSIWQQTNDKDATIFFGSLPQGHHILEIRLYQMPDTTIRFYIEATLPFWRRPWPYVLAIFVSAGLLIAYIYRKARQQQAATENQSTLRESQLSALAAQMNPHFIFNSLNSVQDFIMSNDQLAANDYLSKFASLIRMTLDSSRRPDITLHEELRMIETYLELERIRFDEEIQVTLIRGENLRLSTRLPPLIVQPYIENAFKHGLHHRKGDRRLNVSYFMNGPDTLRVIVEDNGVGRRRAAELNNRSSINASFSTGATARRLELLNDGDQKRYIVMIEDLYTNGKPSGTKVTLNLQLNAPKPEQNHIYNEKA